MIPRINMRQRPYWFLLALTAVILAASGAFFQGAAQQPDLTQPPVTIAPPPTAPQLPQLPQREPRPAKGPEAVSGFVKDISNTDTVFEVLVGQGRILTMKDDLQVVKKMGDKQVKEEALVAVGDPSIAEFVPISARQIRVLGMRLGVTDLSITTADGRTYNFEVRVVADLNVLRGQLQTLYPGTKLELGQMRDHVVVKGKAKDETERTNILLTVRSYLDSVKASQYLTQREKMTQPPLPETYVINLIEVDPDTERAEERKKRREQDKEEMAELEAQLRILFPDATIKLNKINYDIAVSGQARDSAQVFLIVEAIRAYLVTYRQNYIISQTAKAAEALKGEAVKTFNPPRIGEKDKSLEGPQGSQNVSNTVNNINGGGQGFNAQSPLQTLNSAPAGKVINLLRVPGPQQVLLKVRIAELNRTAFREIGAELIYANPNGSSVLGTTFGGGNIKASGIIPADGIRKGLNINDSPIRTFFDTAQTTTVFGIFEREFEFLIRALRAHQLLKILAEPNLVAMNGHEANFLAGGEFPIPVPQSGAGGGPATITIQFKEFGVKLRFKPDILDGGVIRLSVDPEVSSLDFAIGTTLSGTQVPGLNIRKAHTVVEMKEGQTLGMAGLMSVTLEGTTSRIPGLGDVPVLGTFFSNTTGKRTEKELIVLVTPYLVDAVPHDQVPPSPGTEVGGPNDLEFYLHGRIESRTGRDWRETTGYYTYPPVAVPVFLRLHNEYIRGPYGFSD